MDEGGKKTWTQTFKALQKTLNLDKARLSKMKFSEYVASDEFKAIQTKAVAAQAYGSTHADSGSAGTYWYSSKTNVVTPQQEELPFGPSSEVEALQKQVAELQDTLAAAWEAITELQEWVDEFTRVD